MIMDVWTVRVKALRAGYQGKAVVEEVDFSIRRGEIVSLIGPNGAGKSTILRALSRQIGIMAGSMEILGREASLWKGREFARQVSALLTDRPRPEWISCFEVVAMGRYPHTGHMGALGEEDRRQARWALETVGASDLAGREFATLSDGQRQKVLLARALCQKPRILVLDEPTSWLDTRHRLALPAILRRLCAESGMTVILSLHEIDLAQKMSDRVLCVCAGTVERMGSPEEVFEPAYIRRLYGLREELYDPLFGSLEWEKTTGAPRAFVLSAAGSGIPVYRALHRRMVPFSAGILHENDVDCHLARRLAVEVVTEAPFYPISDRAFERALRQVRKTPWVVDAGVRIGPMNERMRDLIECARSLDKYVSSGDFLDRIREEGIF